MLAFGRIPPAVVLLAGLAGCVNSTPYCPRPDIRDEERELRTVERLIRDTRTGLARGYREEDTYGYGGGFVNFCLGGGGSNVGVAVCGDPTQRQTAVPIDPTVEARKLKALETRRGELLSEIKAKSAACTGTGDL